MKNIIQILALSFWASSVWALPNIGVTPKKKTNGSIEFGNSCQPASQSVDLDINNVRTKILNGGDMWWDINVARYEVPKINDPNAVRKNSLFAGALWIGGRDNGGNLKVAAMTYRQGGSDFFPGPLDVSLVSTEPSRCASYDRLWKITRADLEATILDPSAATEDIQSWPATFNRPQRIGTNEPAFLAPYLDADGDNSYNYINGDHPVLDDRRLATDNGISNQPDMFIWMVYNDKGNIHSETQGAPLGVEIQTTAFAYATNDEVNNMTFYSSKLTNRSFQDIKDCYMGQWVDADLGNFGDDYVGCDVNRNLGYCYNGDDDDEGSLGYGLNPPTVGVDYFEGPVDVNGASLGLSHFMYYNNDFDPIRGNPQIAIEYYNLLQGKWLGGQKVTYGGNGLGGVDDAKYMFPASTDPAFPGQCWDEKSASNRPGDRRFIQSTGPFILKAGASQRITTGVVWSRTTSGGAGQPCNASAQGSLKLLELASDKAQTLFNNKFKILDGPDAPTVELQELQNELVLKLLNTGTNKIENYSEKYKDAKNVEKTYKFEGYLIYQLKDATVNTGDLDNVDKARLLYQCDLQNKVGQLINKVFDPKLSQLIPVEKVNGQNKGIQHSLNIKNDLFATSSNTELIDFKNYYYMVISYAYNADDPLLLDPEVFLAGRRNIKVYRGTPHKTEPENFGTKLNTKYGLGPKITQLEGRGNGGNILELTQESIDKILKDGFDPTPTYAAAAGPVKIKIIDPLLVPNADFELVFKETKVNTTAQLKDSMANSATWTLTNLTTGEKINSDRNIAVSFESIQGVRDPANTTNATLKDWGMSIEIAQVANPGQNVDGDPTNGVLDWNVEWEDNGKQWLTATIDSDNTTNPASWWTNWIRSGTIGRSELTFNANIHSHFFTLSPNTDAMDPSSAFSKIWNGRIAPYALTSRASSNGVGSTLGPALSNSLISDNPLSQLSSFQLVLTPDKSKWTRCPVIELGELTVKNLTQGNADKSTVRKSASVDKNGNPTSGTGLGWFPGYAIDLETGERLQLAFGEDSYLQAENGRDMIWNPTSTVFADNGNYPAIGGKHYIYVFGNNWGLNTKTNKGFSYLGENDADFAPLISQLESASPLDKRRAWSNCMWVMPTYLAGGYSMKNGIPPTTVKFSVNVKRAYTTWLGKGQTATNNERPKYRFTTKDIAPTVSNELGVKGLDLINVVPNPYRVYSEYEVSPIDARVKITNLPPTCDITIYDLAGNFVRRFNKADDLTHIDWDLKNNANVPIASGMYLIHVKSKDLGEKVIRWYGIMHTIDLDTY